MKKHETLKEENIELKRENARFKENSVSSSTADVEASSSDSKKVNDGRYKQWIWIAFSVLKGRGHQTIEAK